MKAVPLPKIDSELAEARDAFRARMERAGAQEAWKGFGGRIALVLSGGGARGAYQAGVLLAFQDARLPTHIVAATSIGSMNAAGYAAYSDSLIGNAEPVVDYWLQGVTPHSMGIVWTRYVWMLAGLLAASAGFANLLAYALGARGIRIESQHPALAWLALGLAGLAGLLLSNQMNYLGHLVASFFRGRDFAPNWTKAALSLLANLLVGGSLLVVWHEVHLSVKLREDFERHWIVALAAAGVLVFFLLFRGVWYAPLNRGFHRLLRGALRPGLFSNRERRQYIAERLPVDRLRASPIRVLFTVTDLDSGSPRFFSNAGKEQMAADPGADSGFIERHIIPADDLVKAVVASSAMPLVFEPVRIEDHLYADGGICANQPISPAVRLGADVLFVVMMEALGSRRTNIDSFVDVGLRSLDTLMQQNLLSDVRASASINALCEKAAAGIGVRPEEVEIEMGQRCYRYVPAFAICPAEPLPGHALDTSGKITARAILQGYWDACGQILNFISYARDSRFGQPRRRLRWDLC